MRIWTGKLRLWGRATRTPNGDRNDGEEVTARVIVADGDVTAIDVQCGVDGLGDPRWRVAEPREFDPRSMLLALAMAQPETP